MTGCLCLRSVMRDLRSMERNPDVQEYIIILPQRMSSTMSLGDKLDEYCHKRHLNHLKNNIFGRLHTISSIGAGYLSCDCCKLKHMLSDFAKPYSMLMKLPKENMYVHVDQWNVSYLKSQITELIDIFMYLGATEVSFNVINATTNSDEKGISGDLSEYGINVGLDLEVHHEEQGKDYTSGKIIFKNPNININVLFDTSKFHYLPYKFDWQHMIEQRLQSGISSYRVKSFSEDHMEISHRAQISLQKLGIGIRDSRSSKHNVMIDMYVTFCDLVPTDFSKQSIPILHERWSPNYNRKRNLSETSPTSSLEKALSLTQSQSPTSSDKVKQIDENIIFQEENISKPLDILETINEEDNLHKHSIKNLEPPLRDHVENIVLDSETIFSRPLEVIKMPVKIHPMNTSIYTEDIENRENNIFQENISQGFNGPLEIQPQDIIDFVESQDSSQIQPANIIFKEKPLQSYYIDISPSTSLEEDL